MARQQNGAIEAARREVLVRAAKGFADRLPDRDGPWFKSELLRFHEILCISARRRLKNQARWRGYRN